MKRVVVFGATSRIAQDVGRLLARRGDRLFLVGRSEAKLSEIAEELSPSVAGSAPADLDRLEAAEDLLERAASALGGLDLVFVAHGLLGDQLATERSVDAAKSVLWTNLLSPVAIVLAAANHLERRGGGAIAVITSVAGKRGRPRNYTYGAAKGGLAIYLQGVRSRLYRAGVQVHTLDLGPVDTPMTVDHPKNAAFVSPERAARDIVRALDRGRAQAYVPWFWGPIMAVVVRLPERIFQRLKFLSGR